MLLELGFQSLPVVAGMDLGKHWQLWMGIFIVVAALVLPNGIIGLGAALVGARKARAKGTQVGDMKAKEGPRRWPS
jgi:hypothetical protein